MLEASKKMPIYALFPYLILCARHSLFIFEAFVFSLDMLMQK